MAYSCAIMRMRKVVRSYARAFGLAGLVFITACGSSGGGSSTPGGPDAPPVIGPPDPTCDESFDSTFQAVQSVIFERRGCTEQACHGSAASGGLDMSTDVAYANLIERPSTASQLVRVYPGTKERSFLWLKVLAASDDTVEITGSPMPLGKAPLDETDLELLRLWIQGGAPETGTVPGTADLIHACLPDPEPIIIEPLDPPAPGEGVQLVMPAWDLPPASENEICFATYYDFTDQVPDEFKSADGNFFFRDAFEIRQDPSSHHLLVQAPITAFSGAYVDPSNVSGWACMGGPSAGQACDPLAPDACGAGGTCASPIEETTGCTGYSAAPELTTVTFSGTQQAQFLQEDYPGVFNPVPIRGLVFWNSHAFNLTAVGTKMNGRVNFRFARDRLYPGRNYGGGNNSFGIPRLILEGAAPYTEKVMCEETTLPKGARITALNSHTHKRGKHFWYELHDGEVIYESFVYNDPLQKYFQTPLALDSDTAAERTIKYCSLYNNGVDADGNPDPEKVTRASRIKYGIRFEGSSSPIGQCEPTRCVTPGKYDVKCDDGVRNQRGNDAACDSSPGAGDGLCDACQIMGGVTTENEMFGPSISYFIQN